jgi:hypothetical protein
MPGAEVLMLIWTLARHEGPSSQNSPSVAQTATVVKASVCEAAKQKAWNVQSTDQRTKVVVTVECLPLP